MVQQFLHGCLSHYFEGLAVCMAKAVLSFLSYFKTLTIVPNLEIEPATFRPAIQHPTDLANSAKVKKIF